jgi:two-component system chemotaxis sensor kinase CheA
VPAALPDALVSRFRTVAFEHLERIDAAWIALTSGTATAKSEEQMFRELHTLKGDARVVGFADVAVLCQRLEDLLAAARRRRYRVHDDVDVVVTMAIQFVGMLLRKRGGSARSGIDLDGFLAQIEQVLSEWLRRSSETPDKAVQSRRHLRVDSPHRMSGSSRARLGVVATTVYLEHLRAPGRSRERLREAWDVLSREIADLEASSIEPMLLRHAATARELATDLGKTIDVVVEAREVHASAEIFDAINVAVLHAVRNAVDHGIEPAAQRERAGKPAVGSIRVRVQQRDDIVDVEVADDGAGVDLVAVRAKAERLGLVPAAELEGRTDDQLTELLFAPGFSTAERVSDLSGRGVGLDAVRAAVAERGGSVRMHSVRGWGSNLKLSVPNRNASIDVHVFRPPGSVIALAIDCGWTIEVAGVDPPEPRDALELLGVPSREAEAPGAGPAGPAGVVLSLRRATQRCAFMADGPPWRASALRLCPTPLDAAVEVVMLPSEEALLVRPDVLVGLPKEALDA